MYNVHIAHTHAPHANVFMIELKKRHERIKNSRKVAEWLVRSILRVMWNVKLNPMWEWSAAAAAAEATATAKLWIDNYFASFSIELI